jgi:prevent-host-death family protein
VKTANVHEAKTHLSRLIDAAVKGEPLIIANAGKPLVKVAAIDAAPDKPRKRTGFMTGRIKVPDHFDRMGAKEIEGLFGLDSS